jgi:hypothetical protein
MAWQEQQLRNRLVHFRIRDIYIPNPEEILHTMHGNDLLQGNVLELSDHSRESEEFAIVQVDGLDQPLIVPVERILGVV